MNGNILNRTPRPQRIAADEDATEQARSEMARILGLSDVAMLAPRGEELAETVAIITLRVGRTRGEVGLTYADLGLPTPTKVSREPQSSANADDSTSSTTDDSASNTSDKSKPGPEQEAESLLQLGQLHLLPRRLMLRAQAIESNTRRALYALSTHSPFGYVIAPQAWSAWQQTFSKAQANYFAIRDEMTDNYSEIVTETLRAAANDAVRAFQIATKTGTLAPEFEGKLSEYIAWYVGKVGELIPSRERIKGSFEFRFTALAHPLAALVAKSRAQADQIMSDRALARAEEQAESDMWRDILSGNSTSLKDDLEELLRTALTTVRQMLYEVAVDVLNAVQKNNRMIHKSVEQLNRVLGEIGNITLLKDDTELQRIAEVFAEVASMKHTQEAALEVREPLQAAATVLRRSLLDLGEEPRRARNVGITDTPTIPTLNRARRQLGLDTNNLAATLTANPRRRTPAELGVAA